MKDFIGQELQVGDRVVFVQEHYTALATGQIVKFTKMGARIKADPNQQTVYDGKLYLRFADQLVKVAG